MFMFMLNKYILCSSPQLWLQKLSLYLTQRELRAFFILVRLLPLGNSIVMHPATKVFSWHYLDDIPEKRFTALDKHEQMTLWFRFLNHVEKAPLK